jgi:hypothetical protein
MYSYFGSTRFLIGKRKSLFWEHSQPKWETIMFASSPELHLLLLSSFRASLQCGAVNVMLNFMDNMIFPLGCRWCWRWHLW